MPTTSLGRALDATGRRALRPDARRAQLVRELVRRARSARRRSVAAPDARRAIASGVRAACSSKSCVQRGSRADAQPRVRSIGRRAWRRRSVGISGSARSPSAPGSATIASSRRSEVRCHAARSSRASKRSRAYSTAPAARCDRAARASGRTWRCRCSPPARRSTASPSSAARCAALFCSANMTWNSGLRLRSRSGASSSTSFSNGRSWCA